MKGLGLIGLGALALVGVAVGALAAVYFINNGMTVSPIAPSNTNQTVPTQFSNIKTVSSDQASGTISSFVQSHISNVPSLEVNYLGTMYARLSGAGSLISVSTPITVHEYKLDGNTSLYVNATSLPIIGLGEMALINRSNGTMLCTNFNLTALYNHNYLAALGGSNKLSCSSGSYSFGAYLRSFEYFNLTTLQQYGISINYTTVYQSEYNGEECTYIAGTLSQASMGGEGHFSTCISDTRNIPLTIYVGIKNTQGTGYLLLNET